MSGMEVLKAETIARVAHAGQKEERTGDYYILHVERVVAMVEGPEAKAVAWLHDVLEDTAITEAGLRAGGISESVINAVLLLTRHEGETYFQFYIRRIKQSGNPLALVVKIADLRDHLRPNCPQSLRPRYEKAWATLTGKEQK